MYLDTTAQTRMDLIVCVMQGAMVIFAANIKRNPPIELRTALYYPKIRLSQLFRVNTGPYNRPTNQ